jgi:hypothetical protein
VRRQEAQLLGVDERVRLARGGADEHAVLLERGGDLGLGG